MEGFIGLWPTIETFAHFYNLPFNSIQDPDLPLPKPVVQCGACIITPRQGAPSTDLPAWSPAGDGNKLSFTSETLGQLISSTFRHSCHLRCRHRGLQDVHHALPGHRHIAGCG
jgi:hypothetical protein